MNADFMEAFAHMSPEDQSRWIDMERKLQSLKQEREEMTAERERVYFLRLRFYERWALKLSTWLMSRLPRY